MNEITLCQTCGYAEASIVHKVDRADADTHAFVPPRPPAPIPMILHCPSCCARHVDVGSFAVKPHHTHACQSCGMVWRPAVEPTIGAQFLPGFKDGS